MVIPRLRTTIRRNAGKAGGGRMAGLKCRREEFRSQWMPIGGALSTRSVVLGGFDGGKLRHFQKLVAPAISRRHVEGFFFT